MKKKIGFCYFAGQTEYWMLEGSFIAVCKSRWMQTWHFDQPQRLVHSFSAWLGDEKYLPRKHQESQSEWFGKRSISWHVAVAIKSNSDEMEMITFVHIFESAAAQNNSSVLAIFNNVFSQRKTIMQELQTSIRNDNAEFNHWAQTLIIAPQIAKRQSIQISRIDFSEPQGEKRRLRSQDSPYKVAHGGLSRFWKLHWDCCTDEGWYRVYQLGPQLFRLDGHWNRPSPVARSLL